MATANDPATLGLPEQVTACLFDLDGVLTRTASVHARAWKQTFDAFLPAWAQRTGTPYPPFDEHDDYERYVDGKRRADGVRDFLAARGITLPEGSEDDPPDTATVQGLGNRKNAALLELIEREGVDVFEGSVAYVKAARDAGLRTAVVSSSANTAAVLEVTGLAPLFEARVDGVTARQGDLRGKPAPDFFLAGAAALGTDAAHCAVFEDALAGVEAGRAGGFAFVVGVDRADEAQALAEHGADVVVHDLAELLR